MDTRIAVENAIFPYLLGIICFEAKEQSQEKDDLSQLYDTFEGYLKKWCDELKDHQINSFKKNLEVHSKFIIDLGLDKRTGTNSTTKTVGIIKGLMELVTHVKLDDFHDFMIASQHLESKVYDKFSEQYDAQFDSGSIEKKVRKALEYMKSNDYYKDSSCVEK